MSTPATLKIQDQEILVDDDLLPLLLRFTWRKHARKDYWFTSILGSTHYLHRLVAAAVSGDAAILGKQVHHLRGHLDNRAQNLQALEPAEHAGISNRTRQNKSGYRGITPSGTRWRAQARDNGRVHYLGTFLTALEAHLAYRQFREMA